MGRDVDEPADADDTVAVDFYGRRVGWRRAKASKTADGVRSGCMALDVADTGCALVGCLSTATAALVVLGIGAKVTTRLRRRR